MEPGNHVMHFFYAFILRRKTSEVVWIFVKIVYVYNRKFHVYEVIVLQWRRRWGSSVARASIPLLADKRKFTDFRSMLSTSCTLLEYEGNFYAWSSHAGTGVCEDMFHEAASQLPWKLISKVIFYAPYLVIITLRRCSKLGKL